MNLSALNPARHDAALAVGVTVTFRYDEDFDRARVISIAQNARETFEGMPGLRSKVFTVDNSGTSADTDRGAGRA